MPAAPPEAAGIAVCAPGAQTPETYWKEQACPSIC